MTSTNAERQSEGGRRRVGLPCVGEVTLPGPGNLVFYGVLAAMGVFGIVDWPVVLIVGVGHALAGQRRSPALQKAGEAAQAV